jgi:hypothetical protein
VAVSFSGKLKASRGLSCTEVDATHQRIYSIWKGLVSPMHLFKTTIILLALLLACNGVAFAEVKTPQILAKPMGTMLVKPVNILECILVWTNYQGAKLEFKGIQYRGGSISARNSLAQSDWHPFLAALKRAKDSKASKDEHIRWVWPTREAFMIEKPEDELDIQVVVNASGRHFRLRLHSQVALENQPNSLDYELNQQQLLQLIDWVEGAIEQVSKWPKSDPNPWNDRH